MNATQDPTTISTTSWEIPAYEKFVFKPRKSVYCVVIPVINEGDRIKSLLKKMTDLKISYLVDIVIVDGGSVDDSLRPELLKAHNVSALLVKSGPGRLSSQLRCAYSFALLAGYEGIITIDGNDKDDPKDIPHFISALEKGMDFVQGSRFIEGGTSQNTPLIRSLAIKLIHAPMLWAASGFRWTDTTQGFRGYSRKLLCDKHVSPFRNIFSDYELLFYLSYIAPRLNYSCCELPTSRIYPKGKVPTKITGLRANYSLLVTLGRVCVGDFNVKESNLNEIQ